MLKCNIFVDGSNLMGSLSKINLNIKDYGKFYNYIFKKTIEVWKDNFYSSIINDSICLTKIYWYVVGTIDNLDLGNDNLLVNLKKIFTEDKDLHRLYLHEAGISNPGKKQYELENIAWNNLFKESKEWYEKKKKIIDECQKFYFAVQSNCNCIDIKKVGNWKVDFIHKTVDEKGVDTSFSVDMVTLIDNYDIAILISGDADSIPSVDYLKKMGKPISVLDFIDGYPPAEKGKQTSSRLKVASDFVIPIYETDLINDKIAEKKESLTKSST